jgi:hypothetical protein
MRFLLAIAILALAGCAPAVKATGSVSALPKIKVYSETFKTELRGEQPLVKACCPRTSDAMYDYGRLRQKIIAAEGIRKAAGGELK